MMDILHKIDEYLAKEPVNEALYKTLTVKKNICGDGEGLCSMDCKSGPTKVKPGTYKYDDFNSEPGEGLAWKLPDNSIFWITPKELDRMEKAGVVKTNK